MSNRAIIVVSIVALMCFAFTSAVTAGETSKSAKTTITGMGKALGEASGKLDPTAANATVTVTTTAAGKDTQEVYYVYGWAGVIVAKQGDGKKVEVAGTVAEKDSKKTITGKSIDVKIVVVDEKKTTK
jgi:hypothetical protein